MAMNGAKATSWQAPLSVVVPCFNEESNIPAVIAGIDECLRSSGLEPEIIVVDDGSTDRTADLLSECPTPLKIIRHRFNRGYGASLKVGIKAASHEYVLVVDADGQHPPRSCLELLNQCDGYDMVIGARRGQGSHHWRMPGKLLLRVVAQLLAGTRIPDINSGLRLIRRSEACRCMHLCSDEFSFSTSITLAFLSLRLSVKFVPVGVRARVGGKSRVKLSTGFSALMLVLRIIGTFNPLRIFMPPAILSLVAGLILLIQGLLQSNVGDVAILCLLGSMILFCFGLLADQMSLLRREISKSS
jgi:glycosyltransferase involved in cell wall biosynthesis